MQYNFVLNIKITVFALIELWLRLGLGIGLGLAFFKDLCDNNAHHKLG